MHNLEILSIRFTSEKEVNTGKEALTVFIEKSLGSQENLAIENMYAPSSQARLMRNTGLWHW
jgi:hypothetical protein